MQTEEGTSPAATDAPITKGARVRVTTASGEETIAVVTGVDKRTAWVAQDGSLFRYRLQELVLVEGGKPYKEVVAPTPEQLRRVIDSSPEHRRPRRQDERSQASDETKATSDGTTEAPTGLTKGCMVRVNDQLAVVTGVGKTTAWVVHGGRVFRYKFEALEVVPDGPGVRQKWMSAPEILDLLNQKEVLGTKEEVLAILLLQQTWRRLLADRQVRERRARRIAAAWTAESLSDVELAACVRLQASWRATRAARAAARRRAEAAQARRGAQNAQRTLQRIASSKGRLPTRSQLAAATPSPRTEAAAAPSPAALEPTEEAEAATTEEHVEPVVPAVVTAAVVAATAAEEVADHAEPDALESDAAEGMVLQFGGIVTGEGIDAKATCKTFPAGVYYFLIEGWK